MYYRALTIVFGLTSLLLVAYVLRVERDPERRTLYKLAFSNRSQEELYNRYFEAQEQLNLTRDEELASLVPDSLQAKHNSQTQALRVPGYVPHVPFHWVINSCTRDHWGRTLTSTILSGLMHGLRPESISISWCKHYDADKIPSLLFNLRHSIKFRVFYLPETLPVASASTLLSGLLVPHILNQPDLPLLVTEDDIIFAPDAGTKLSWLIPQAQEKSRGAPFFLTLYNPPEAPLDSVQKAQKLFNSQPEFQTLTFPQQQSSKAGSLKQWKRSFWYGNQGVLLSPAMTKYMARHIYQIVTKQVEIDKGFRNNDTSLNDLPDQVFKDFLVRYGCAFKFDPEAPCQVFNVEPSLVQHVGISSSIFKPRTNESLHPQFHLAVDFPVAVRMPGEDAPQWW